MAFVETQRDGLLDPYLRTSYNFSKHAKEIWSNPTIKAKILASHKARAEENSANVKALWSNPTYRQKQIESHKRGWTLSRRLEKSKMVSAYIEAHPEVRDRQREVALSLWRNKKLNPTHTKLEDIITNALSKKGLSFQDNIPIKLDKKVCIPDHVNNDLKIAVFDDGDYWHGNPSTKCGLKLDKCVRDNIQRDYDVTTRLIREGWMVLRFYESDIRHNLEWCLNAIERAYLIRGGYQ